MSTCVIFSPVNLKDFDVDVNPITKEFHFDVKFEGIDVTLVQDDNDFLYAGLTGSPQ